MAYSLRTKSMRHQEVALERALKRPTAFAYLAETGTGKTHMVLKEFQHRFGEIQHLLLIAPAASIRNWYADKSNEEPSELRKHLDENLFKKLLIVTNSKKAYWRYQRKQMGNGKACALFVNIESLSRGDSKNPSEAEQLCSQLLASGNCMMVIDESTTIRSRDSNRTKSIMRLGKKAYCRRILTGLVTPKSPLDLYCQMNFLDPEILNYPSFTAFRSRYAKVKYFCQEPTPIVDMRLRQVLNKTRRKDIIISELSYDEKVRLIIELGGWIKNIPIIHDYQNMDELNKRIRPHCYQILKKDCLDLKSKTYQFRYVELNKAQAKAYKEVLEDATSQLSNGAYVSTNSVIDQMIRLHQIVCGHVRDEEKKLHDLGTHRTEVLLDILNEHEGKAIIWVTYDFELRRFVNAIAKEFGEESVAAYWGGNFNTRHEHEAKFLLKPNCRFMVSTQMTGGKGNTWNVANLAIYAANNHNLEHRFQSEDRNHRIGQTDKVTYIDLMVPETVEEKIISALRRKIDLNTIITGENYREWLV